MQESSFYLNDDFILGLSRDQGIQSSRIGLISNWVSTIQEKNIYFIFFKMSHHAFNKKSGLIVGHILFLEKLGST